MPTLPRLARSDSGVVGRRRRQPLPAQAPEAVTSRPDRFPGRMEAPRPRASAACGAIANAKSDARLTERLGAAAVALARSPCASEEPSPHQGACSSISDPRFDPIAHRPDFRALKTDLAFPANPFAPATS